MSARPGFSRPDDDPLTAAEVDVLRLAAEGKGVMGTAAVRFCARETVKRHRGNLSRKLGAKNITNAVAIAYERGILGEALGRPEAS